MEIQNIFELLMRYCYQQKFPDIHLSSGSYPLIRSTSGNIETLTTLESSTGQRVDLNPIK